MGEACRRDDLIRALVANADSGRIGWAAGKAAADKLGLDILTLY